MRVGILTDKSTAFAIRVVRLFKYLQKEHNEYILSRQMLRSGTSIGANIAESVYAQSDADFITKLTIALKEASETAYWLKLLAASEYLNEKEYESINNNCTEIIKLLIAAIKKRKAAQN